jgi:hypothetical protein
MVNTQTLTQWTSLQQRNITCKICQETCTGLPNLTFYTSALATGYCGHINTVQHKVFTHNNNSKNKRHIYFPSCTWMLKILYPLTFWKSLMSLKTQYSWINIPKYSYSIPWFVPSIPFASNAFHTIQQFGPLFSYYSVY